MAWNQAEYDRGVNDALSMGREDTIPNMIWRYCQMTNVGEYRVGYERGIRRRLIDDGEHVMCAQFTLMTTASQDLWSTVFSLVREGKARWIRDPEHWGVMGLASTEGQRPILMVVYLEDGDFEESMAIMDAIEDLHR